MNAFSATVNDVKASINDFLNCRAGQVSDLALSLINRARDHIWQYKPWSYLMTSATLTLDSNQETELPYDYGRVYRITDSETTFWPVYSFEHTDKTRRYTFVNNVSIEFGIYQKIKFYNSQTSLFLRYIQKIEDVSEDDHFLLFPANLIIRAAEIIHALDEQQKESKINSLQNAFDLEIRDFQQYYHSDNVQMTLPQRDYYGTNLYLDDITMAGD